MPKITNLTDQPITASTGHTVPAGGSLGVSSDTYMRLLDDRYFALQISKGRIVVAGGVGHADAYASVDDLDKWAGDIDAAEPITREDIAKMKRAELLDVILAHYDGEITAEDFSGVTVEDKDGEDGLRTIAARLVFSEL